ncbi:double zinc ribbon domain-containing protein [Neotabrizicola shimadae]|nr:double zinc ribbon domain-containing protein [Neotabrizicola shimadae]
MSGTMTATTRAMQAALHVIYPPQCISCGAPVTTDFGLCGPCWRQTPFVSGLVCDLCGTPLPGEDPGAVVHCDDCLTIARPWNQGRAALLYKDNARQLVLSLKHGDRLDLARPAAVWMTKVATPLLSPGTLVAPVPLHWWRLAVRRYNQSALLSKGVARLAGMEHCPDLLKRRRATPSQEGRTRDERFANLSGALTLHPRHVGRVKDRPVLLVDDVMTSGATLAAAAEACVAAGASRVSVVVLARVAKDA